jgi:hypothetical protein
MLYQKCADLKKQKKFVEAKAIYRRIINYGIVALPQMFDKLETGDIDMIPAISELTDNKVKTDFSVNECLEWWKNNNNDYLVFPGQEHLKN